MSARNTREAQPAGSKADANLQLQLAVGFERATAELRGVLARASTSEVVWHCFNLMMKGPAQTTDETGLHSPFKQSYFLLALALTTPEPAGPGRLGEPEWEYVHEILVAVDTAYLRLFFPDPVEMSQASEDEKHRLSVAMVAFLHHFNTGVLASVEQIVQRVRDQIIPFDDVLKAKVGLAATEALEMVDWLRDRVQGGLDRLVDSARSARAAAESARLGEWTQFGIKAEGAARAARSWFSDGSDPLEVSRRDFENSFGAERVAAFWDLFVSERGSIPAEATLYYTQENPAERRPLFAPDRSRLYCPGLNPVYVAVLTQFAQFLRADPETEHQYLRRRDTALERRTETLFHAFFGPDAEVFSSFCETPTRQFEHDLIVLWNRNLLVIEAKAAAPVEPRRDPDQSFTRLRDSFRKKSGIQSAYEQTMRITRRLRQGEQVSLFAPDGTLARVISPSDVDRTYGICVTADNFGALATDLSTLLEKDAKDEYPWVVNIYDLETFFDALKRKGWGPAELLAYIDQRAHFHGHTSNSDELEFAGAFILHGNLCLPPRRGTHLVLDPHYADVFDAIDAERRGGPPADLSPRGEMVITDATDAIRAQGERLSELFHGSAKRQRPNEPCACGSARKFKRCCGSGCRR